MHLFFNQQATLLYFRKEFLRETSWLASLRDPNLVKVVGLCSQEEPLCVLQEHCEFGDLPTFLQLQAGAGAHEDNPTVRYYTYLGNCRYNLCYTLGRHRIALN